MNKFTLLGSSLVLCAGAVTAADYQVETLADGLSNPWSLAFLPDGGMLVTERSGQLRLIDAAGQLRAEPVAGVPEAFVNGQSGLMEVALAPDFAESGELFLSYSCGTRDANHTCLAAATFNGEALENPRAAGQEGQRPLRWRYRLFAGQHLAADPGRRL